jgi:hypothetical protein
MFFSVKKRIFLPQKMDNIAMKSTFCLLHAKPIRKAFRFPEGLETVGTMRHTKQRVIEAHATVVEKPPKSPQQPPFPVRV